MAIKFFNDHALDIVSNDDIKAIAPKAVEALHTLNAIAGSVVVPLLLITLTQISLPSQIDTTSLRADGLIELPIK